MALHDHIVTLTASGIVSSLQFSSILFDVQHLHLGVHLKLHCSSDSHGHLIPISIKQSQFTQICIVKRIANRRVKFIQVTIDYRLDAIVIFKVFHEFGWVLITTMAKSIGARDFYRVVG